MSGKASGAAFDVEGLAPNVKFVLVALADHADHEGRRAFPGQALLIRKTGLSERTVQNALRVLEKAGLIVPVRLYTETTPTEYDLPFVRGGQGVPPRTFVAGQDVPPRGANGDKGGGQQVPLNGTNQPSDEPSLPNTVNLSNDLTPSWLASLWNASMPSPPFSRVAGLSEERKTKARLRLAAHPEPVFWEAVVSKAAASPFCRGGNDKGWKVSFDWLIKNEGNCLKVAEGKYDRDSPTE